MDVYGLLGNPVGHSLSPPMHEAAYDALDLDARYVTFEPEPAALEDALSGAGALGISGLNVTIPFKEPIVDLVEPDATAERIGAVNTIDLDADPPRGYNTDAAGARRALDHHDVDLEGATAVVLGAGGAARAIAVMLADAGASVHVANRTVERAADLAAAVGGTAHDLVEVDNEIAAADVLVNATSVGMEREASPVPAGVHHEELVVMDAVYSPLETRFLRDAAAAGATTIDGAWMLLFQGAEAIEIWTGEPAPVDAMNRALRAALESG